ncbi:MAG: hypothetical protein JRJ46_01030, partial [Deltaproteobacteria bacterium]|nr:hypothetical protein [Deltaproteobacteria bacterium]
MKNNVYELKKKKIHREEKELHTKSLIDLDQPFDYKEVAAVAGSEYVRNLQRDGMSFIFYEELKSNFADLLVNFV